ncbi:MAG: hypothetical protein SVG88_07420 [Halobacteriales archaeon]|nr:hypothetical protein [Halobacteriales archaeon]
MVLGIEPWQLMAGLSVVLVLYGLGTQVLNLPASVGGLVVLLLFGGLGIAFGRYLGERYAEED